MIGKIFIKDIHINCIVGVGKEERKEKQIIIVSVVVFTNVSNALKTDSVGHTINYSSLRKKIIRSVEKSNFHLLEGLANMILNLCLEDKKIIKAKVKVEKPNKYPDTKSVGIEIERERIK
jgi:FolB domain-containing protein